MEHDECTGASEHAAGTTMHTLSRSVSRVQAHSSADPWSRLFARLCLAGLPRGGGNGDDIRMGILNVMRENGIKEGHRQVREPGAEVDVVRGSQRIVDASFGDRPTRRQGML